MSTTLTRRKWERIGQDEYGRAIWKYGPWIVAAMYDRHPLGADRKPPRPSAWVAERGDDAFARTSLKLAKMAVEAMEIGG